MQLYDGWDYLEITSGPRANKQDQKLLPSPSAFDEGEDYPQDATIVYGDLENDRYVYENHDIDNAMQAVQWRSIELVDESEEKIKIRDHLQNCIIWQDAACEKMADVIDIWLNMPIPRRWPLAVVMLPGPTWTGKTLTAQSLAELFFWDDQSLIRINCDDLQSPHSATKLFGAPDSLVGFGMKKPLHSIGEHFKSAKKKWKLNSILKSRKSCSILLLDEFEKAAPNIAQSFLGAFDTWLLSVPIKAGKWNSYEDRVIDLSNTIVIMTTNIGQTELKSRFGWFTHQNSEKEESSDHQKVNETIEKHFSREFLWRVDSVIHYNWLKKSHGVEIIDRYISTQAQKLLDYYIEWNIQLSLSSDLKIYLLDKWFNNKTWARSLLRIVEDNIMRRVGRIVRQSHIAHSLNQGDTNIIHFDILGKDEITQDVYTIENGMPKSYIDSINKTPVQASLDNIYDLCQEINDTNALESAIDSLSQEMYKFYNKFKWLNFTQWDIAALKQIDQEELIKNINVWIMATPSLDIYRDTDVFWDIPPRAVKRIIEQHGAKQLMLHNDPVEVSVLRLIVSSFDLFKGIIKEKDLTDSQKTAIMLYSSLTIYSMYDQ